jgi:hypothetical protein
MALTPPFDQAVKPILFLFGKMNGKVGEFQSKLLNQLTELQSKVTDLPDDIKCSDPRINDIKQDIQRVNDTISDIQTIFNNIQTVVNILLIIATITAVAITLSLIVPIPLPPVVTKALEVAAVIIATILGILRAITGLIALARSMLSNVSSALGPILNKLGSICNNETFVVNTDTANSILNDISKQTAGYRDMTETEFYRNVNVSEDDLQDRQQKIEQLLEQQRNLIDNLIEAPSQVINDVGVPSTDIGNIGDYYIDETNKNIYGPKISDTDWGTPVNY